MMMTSLNTRAAIIKTISTTTIEASPLRSMRAWSRSGAIGAKPLILRCCTALRTRRLRRLAARRNHAMEMTAAARSSRHRIKARRVETCAAGSSAGESPARRATPISVPLDLLSVLSPLYRLGRCLFFS
jgi:hypothetical protein